MERGKRLASFSQLLNRGDASTPRSDHVEILINAETIVVIFSLRGM